ncbi:hypothetical protein BDW59DRAFT_167474 [Aspergillus cavernicola]|uniref:Uncharacterized protein n=1 Tax=Aspergillus cavernicola TaxID=176166 RepID=A0ABR4HEN0_9EURO
MTEAYSYEDHESPGLEVVKPDLKPRVPTPPPFGNQSQSPTSDDSKKAGKGRKSRFPKPLRDGEREATAALLQGTIAAFKPEVWRYEKDHPHTFGPFPVDHNYRSRGATNPIKPESTKGELTSTAASALGLLLQESPQSRDPQSHHWKDSTNGPGDPKATPNSDPDRERSHSLSKFLITDPESRNSLPALRDPSTARSPGNAGTTLPPIQTQLGQLAPVLSPPNGLPARIVGTPSYPLPPWSEAHHNLSIRSTLNNLQESCDQLSDPDRSHFDGDL